MRALRLVLALVVVASVAPAALAQEDAEALCIIFVRPSQDFTVLEIAADLILTPEQRANLSVRVDANDDGAIDAAEVEAYENATRTNYDGLSIPHDRRMLLDGAPATSLDVRTKLRDWTGPRVGAEKGVVTELRYYRFDAYPSQEHVLEGALYVRPIPTSDPQAVIEVVVIDAPADWRIAKVVQSDADGRPVNETYPDATSHRVSGFDLSRGSVVFHHESAPRVTAPPSVEPPPPPPEPSYEPAPGTLAAVLTLALVAAIAGARSRRRAP